MLYGFKKLIHNNSSIQFFCISLAKVPFNLLTLHNFKKHKISPAYARKTPRHTGH